MAGDWIKMRADLFTHPKVVRISSALKADNLRTVGGLMSVWCLFDAHSVDGRLDGYTPEAIDDHLRWPGFYSAMAAVRWIDEDGESLVLPEFDTHNGLSAKRRAQDADRKRSVRNVSASEADKMRTREEKRREEKKEAKAKADAPPAKRGHRIPADWEPSDEDIAFAMEQRVEWRREADKFRDYWNSKTGQAATKLDWTATWRNWIRSAQRTLGPQAAPATSKTFNAVETALRIANGQSVDGSGNRNGNRQAALLEAPGGSGRRHDGRDDRGMG